MNDNLFLAAARTGQNAFWRYAVTLALILVLVFASSTFLVLSAIVITGSFDVLGLPPTPFLFINLVPFIFIPLGLWAGLALLHKRSFFSIINPRTWKFDWRRFFLSAGIWLLLAALTDLGLALVQPGNYVFKFDLVALLPFAVVALIGIPIQSAAEELLFRGYLTQGFGLVGGLWMAWLVPSVFFGLLHGSNPEVGAYGLLFTLPVYIALGLMLGWVTLRSESLELALGLHIANNLYSSLMVTFPSSALKSPALFTIQNYNAPLSMVTGLAAMVIYLLIISQVGKSFFRQGLFGGKREVEAGIGE